MTNTNIQYQLQSTIRDLRKAYKKDDPLLIAAIKNARVIFLRSKRPVRELASDSRMDHWIGHAMTTNKPAKIKGYCKHKIRKPR